MIDLSVEWTANQWANLTIVMHRHIRHEPAVAAHLAAKAEECRQMAGDNFKTGLQNREGTTRARAWIRPANGEGIHDEKADGLLTKAAVAMRGR